MAKITVIDSTTGSGKTSWAIQEMRDPINQDKRYIFATPFIDEIKRIRKATRGVRDFQEPQYMDGRKLNGFNDLLALGVDIGVSHVTFTNADETTRELLRDNRYTLILDEVVDPFKDFKEAVGGDNCPPGSYKGNMKFLLEGGYVRIDELYRVHWIKDESYPDGAYSQIEKLARNGSLLWIDNKYLEWELPPELFNLFDEVIILTYRFDAGCWLNAYFQYHGLEYEKRSVEEIGGKYQLCPYRDESRAKYRDLIAIEQNLAKHYSDGELTTSGLKAHLNKKNVEQQTKSLKKAGIKYKPLQKRIKDDLYNYFSNVCRAKAPDILWTCKGKYKKDFKGRGYTSFMVKTLNKDGTIKLEKVECFLPLNARATNAFRDRHYLAYCHNMKTDPRYRHYLAKRTDGDGKPIAIDEDLFALSCLIQWVWRSAIRDLKPIKIYILSPRMKRLFESWLADEI